MHFSATYASFNANRPIRKDTVWKNEKFTLIQNIIFVKSIPCASTVVKTLISRNFRQKSVRVNFRHFHTVK